MNCKFKPTDYVHSLKREKRLYRCSRLECGNIILVDPTQKPGRVPCKQPSMGAGDAVAKILGSVGIKKKAGCNCEARQKALNALLQVPKPNFVSWMLGRVVAKYPQNIEYSPVKGWMKRLWRILFPRKMPLPVRRESKIQ